MRILPEREKTLAGYRYIRKSGRCLLWVRNVGYNNGPSTFGSAGPVPPPNRYSSTQTPFSRITPAYQRPLSLMYRFWVS
jgi:hypothetical protein